MKNEEYSFKPKGAVPILVVLGILFLVSIFFAFRGNWMLLALCLVVILLLLPGEFRLLNERIFVCDDHIKLQNVSCVNRNTSETLQSVEIKWCDIQSITFHTGLKGTNLSIKTKSRYKSPRTYIKQLDGYFGVRYDRELKKMKTVLLAFWRKNKRRNTL